MKRILSVTMVLMLFAGAFMITGCAKEEAPMAAAAPAPAAEAAPVMEKSYSGKIGVSLPTATHGYMGRVNWWVQKSVKDWEEKHPELEFLVVSADSVTKQASDIEDLMIKEIDALVCFPFDSSLTAVIEKAYNAGIYTVVLDRGATKPVYDVYISNDDEGYTREGTKWIAEQLGNKGKIVIIEGIPSVINSIRVDTIKETAAKYGLEVLDSQPGMWNPEKALAVMENYLQKYPEIDAVYTADDDMMKGALQAYKESGRDDIKIFLGGGADKEILKMIMDDSNPLVKANVTYPPDCIATAVGLAVLGLNDQVFEGFYQKKLPIRIILAAELVTKENADQYYVEDELNFQ
ncbi:ribose ABC transporter substrate-binding protein [Oceanispirochaeta crateris]|jgi:ribose transport system substrate-binding protein|uniref:Ribose ABC transporter substrate-binding protein n=1 Tax=Oceanispirochaeta crateris TaxID=2518645 RepID=A0A5C1QKK3_9SPIO|nr:substrate-binding domain-containing protein [Oceanispirochaeta crateris]QEN08121.1 ribose ABC transporter substrate-binding protein [Oceanispirochaeta crateris]